MSSTSGGEPLTIPPVQSADVNQPRGRVLKRVLKLWPLLAAIGSGVLLALSYAPWDQGGLVWFALTPLISAVWFRKGRRNFGLGYVTGLVFFTITFSWLHSLGELFHTPLLFGLPLLLALYLALYPAMWTWFLGRVLIPTEDDRRFPNSWRNLATGALAASAWTALEWMRGWMLSGFGWNGLGVALHRDLPMIQIADTIGVLGLTWLVAFTNVMAVIIVRRILGELGPVFLKRIRWEFSLSISLITIVFAYGTRVLMAKAPPVTRSARVAVIQPNIPQEEKFDPESEDKTFEQLERLTGMANTAQPDFVIWPEAAVPRGVYADETNFDFIQKVRASLHCPLLVGTLIDAPEEDPPKLFNGAVLFSPGDAPITERPPEYRKVHLVPFGEYLPLRFILGPIVGGLVPGDIDAGAKLQPLSHPQLGQFATLICFEDTLGNLTRGFFSSTWHPPSLLVNITNDGWFLKTCAVEQHLANATFRAIETRRPLLRCANTGVTCLVQPTGHIDRWLDPFRQGFAVRPVEIRDEPQTLYLRFGDWVAWVSAALTTLVIARRFIHRRQTA